jgi:hypothetical protein
MSPTNGTPHDHVPTVPADAKPQAAEGGRDGHGRFADGNGGGPGNPFAGQVAALRSALLAAVTAQDMAEIAQALVRRAKEGHVTAAKLLLAYTLGKPAAPAGPGALDRQEGEGDRRPSAPLRPPTRPAAAPPAAPLDEKTLARLGRLLDRTPPTATDVRLCQAVPPPSTNGVRSCQGLPAPSPNGLSSPDGPGPDGRK